MALQGFNINSYNSLLREKIELGHQIGALRLIASGVEIPSDLIALMKTQDYRVRHPKTYATLENLINAHGRYHGNSSISEMSQRQKTEALYEKIKQGRQIGALDLIAHGARLNAAIISLLESDEYQLRFPITYEALKPYVEAYKQQYNAGLTFAQNENLAQGYHIGDGGFGSHGLTHDEIIALKARTGQNRILNKAYHLIEGYDHAQLNDVDYLINFLHQAEEHPASTHSIIGSMKNDRIACKKVIRTLSDNAGGNLTNRHAIRALGLKKEDDPRTNDWNMLDEAIQMLKDNPEISKGILPNRFCEYRGRRLCALKTALAYSAAVKGATEEDFKHLKGFFRLHIPNDAAKSAALNMKTRKGNTLYVPSSGYFFGADQRLLNENGTSDAFISDCSGTVNNLIRDVKPELLWFKNHRFGTWNLRPAHDALSSAGPLTMANDHRNLTSSEINDAENLSQSERELTRVFKPVSDKNDMRPGDIILWTTKGRDDNGHVGIVADYTPGNQKAMVIHDTMAGESRFGVGISKENVLQSGRDTRILRFR